jgi:hypothetical protein
MSIDVDLATATPIELSCLDALGNCLQYPRLTVEQPEIVGSVNGRPATVFGLMNSAPLDGQWPVLCGDEFGQVAFFSPTTVSMLVVTGKSGWYG